MHPATLDITQAEPGVCVARLAGAWRIDNAPPAIDVLVRELGSVQPRLVRLDASAVDGWDSTLAAFVARVVELCRERSIELERNGWPAGVERLVALAQTVSEQNRASAGARPSWLARIGAHALAVHAALHESLAFLGQSATALLRWLTLRASMRRSDLWLQVQECGVEALPIVTLISLLVGLILAFVGAVQLRQFGAAIYVADMVSIAMVREMGSMMAGIIMAGRTGAAFAAQLGTMKVTEEIDALTTFGISPIEFLVLPRMLALCLMMPLLALYANVLGIAGGAAVGVGMLDLAPRLYLDQTLAALSLVDLLGGLFKSAVYGALVAVAGCMNGLRCGDQASAVGDAATRAVVSGIVAIIVADGLFAVVFNVLGI